MLIKWGGGGGKGALRKANLNKVDISIMLKLFCLEGYILLHNLLSEKHFH